jgi:triphosphatase
MTAEIEIKLDMPASSSASPLLARRWLKRIEAAPIVRQRLVSVYYDTRKEALRRKGVSLRVRRGGGRYVQTVKADCHGAGGPFGRAEWESNIDRQSPDLSRAKHTALDGFKRKKLRRRLRPIFTTDIRRVAIPVRVGGTEMEIAVDRGTVKAGGKHAAIRQIEIELKRGDPVQLVKLAERIAEETRAAYDARSKAERGYVLKASGGPQVVCAERIDLDPDATAAEAFQIIALSCLRHIDGNRDAVRQSVAEGVHQMRVGLRRLQAAMSFFKDLLQDAESARIKASLKSLRGELGLARDLDVLISESVDPLRRAKVDGTGLTALKGDLARRRRHGFAGAKAAASGEQYRRLVLETALWIVGGGWTRSSDSLGDATHRRAVVDFADHELARRHRKIVKKLEALEQLDPRRRHKLRIAVKKLRYADDFFVCLHRGRHARRRLKRHRAALKRLQSALGKLNDLQVHEKMAGALVELDSRVAKKSQKSFAMGLIVGTDQAQTTSLMAAAGKAGHRLAAQRPFRR